MAGFVFSGGAMNYFAILLVLIAGAAWAGTGLAAQDFFSKSSLTPMDLTVFRMVCTGILMGLLTAAERKLGKNIKAIRREPKLILSIVIYGVGGLLAMHYTYFASIAAGNAAAATVIQYTAPAMVIFWAVISGRRLPSFMEMAAVLLAFGGTVLLVTGGNTDRLSVPFDCVWLGLLSAFFFAVCMVLPKHLMVKMDNHFLIAGGMLLGALAAWFMDPVTDFSGFFAEGVRFDVFWIVILGTMVAFICYNAGLSRLPQIVASVTTTVEPAISVIASYFLFHSHFGFWEILGVLMVLAAIAGPPLSEMGKKK